MVYQYLGVPDRIGTAYRSGGHQIDMNDYNAIMDFSDKHLEGLPVTCTFDTVPYPAPTPAQIPLDHSRSTARRVDGLLADLPDEPPPAGPPSAAESPLTADRSIPDHGLGAHAGPYL